MSIEGPCQHVATSLGEEISWMTFDGGWYLLRTTIVNNGRFIM